MFSQGKRGKRSSLVRAAWGLLGLVMCTSTSVGEVILSYDGSNSETSLAASATSVGMVPIDLLRGEGLNVGGGNTFNSSGWNDEATDYLEWGWSSSPPLDLTTLDLRYDRSASGPSQLDVQLAVNGGVFQSIYVDTDVATNSEEALNVDLTGFMGITAATFRLFGTNASSAGGTFDIEPLAGVSPASGIRVSGTTAVPEPSSFCLLAIAGLGLIVARRWQR